MEDLVKILCFSLNRQLCFLTATKEKLEAQRFRDGGRCKQRSTEFYNLSLEKILNCLTFSVLCQEENHLSLPSDICTVDRTSSNRALSDYKKFKLKNNTHSSVRLPNELFQFSLVYIEELTHHVEQ